MEVANVKNCMKYETRSLLWPWTKYWNISFFRYNSSSVWRTKSYNNFLESNFQCDFNDISFVSQKSRLMKYETTLRSFLSALENWKKLTSHSCNWKKLTSHSKIPRVLNSDGLFIYFLNFRFDFCGFIALVKLLFIYI